MIFYLEIEDGDPSRVVQVWEGSDEEHAEVMVDNGDSSAKAEIMTVDLVEMAREILKRYD